AGGGEWGGWWGAGGGGRGRPPAVIAHVDDLDAVVERERRVLRRGDALEREADVVDVLEALHVIPGEPGLEVEAGRPHAPRLDEALREVALAPAIAGRVDGQAERGVAVIDGALDVVVDPGVVAADVKLE